jgi:predicted amidohydrolase YtcJ
LKALSRIDTPRLYTAENGWFFHKKNKVGTIEAGKLDDVVVLSGDYFDAAKVSDEGIKKLKSVMTVVDAKIVHNEIR